MFGKKRAKKLLKIANKTHYLIMETERKDRTKPGFKRKIEKFKSEYRDVQEHRCFIQRIFRK